MSVIAEKRQVLTAGSGAEIVKEPTVGHVQTFYSTGLVKYYDGSSNNTAKKLTAKTISSYPVMPNRFNAARNNEFQTYSESAMPVAGSLKGSTLGLLQALTGACFLGSMGAGLVFGKGDEVRIAGAVLAGLLFILWRMRR